MMLEVSDLSCLCVVFPIHIASGSLHPIRSSSKMNVKKANVFYFRSTLPFGMGNFLKLKHEQNGFSEPFAVRSDFNQNFLKLNYVHSSH